MVNLDEPGQRELVHRVNLLKLHDAEKQDGGMFGHRPVTISCLDLNKDKITNVCWLSVITSLLALIERQNGRIFGHYWSLISSL